MTIDKIKEQVKTNQGNIINIKYNGARNKIEVYEAKIKEIYNFIFTVELLDSDEKKSFSYADVLTKTVEIKFPLDFNVDDDKI